MLDYITLFKYDPVVCTKEQYIDLMQHQITSYMQEQFKILLEDIQLKVKHQITTKEDTKINLEYKLKIIGY